MRTLSFRTGVLLWALAAVGASCGGGDPLDYDTAMSLLRDHNGEPVKTVFSASPRFEANDPRVGRAYRSLAEANVIKCSEAASVGTICAPGPAGDDLNQEGSTDLTLVAGRWTPAAILSIQKTGAGSASAEVRMAFEPTQLYHEFESALDVIQTAASTLALADKRQGKVMKAAFQRFEDGWHLESIQ